MPIPVDEPRLWLPSGRSLSRVDLRTEPLSDAPAKPGRYEQRTDGALLHVAAGCSYMSEPEGAPVVRDGRVAVRGRCLDANGCLGVVARVRRSGEWLTGYVLLVDPGASAYSLSDFRVSRSEVRTRVVLDWLVSDRLRATGESNLVELRHVGPSMQVFLNGFLVDEVTDEGHESGASGWAVRAFDGVGDVLLEEVEVSDSAPSGQLAMGVSVDRGQPLAAQLPLRELVILCSRRVGDDAEAAPAGLASVELTLGTMLPGELDAMPDRLVSPAFWTGRLEDPSFNPLAHVPNASPAMLTALARSQRVALRRVVAAHPRCPDETLARLAADVAPAVRLAVACRPYCPPLVLDRLASDEHAMVREAVASHALATAPLLERLGMDEDASVLAAVALHPGCPPALRARLATPAERPGARPRRERVAFVGRVRPGDPTPS